MRERFMRLLYSDLSTTIGGLRLRALEIYSDDEHQQSAEDANSLMGQLLSQNGSPPFLIMDYGLVFLPVQTVRKDPVHKDPICL